MPSTDEQTAAHEAGHAVVSYLTGGGIRRLRILPAADGSDRGACYIRKAPANPVDNASIDLAGAIADALEGIRRDDSAYDPDFQSAGAIVAGAAQEYGHEPGALIEAACDRAEALLRQYYAAYRLVARVLLAYPDMDGAAAEELVRLAIERTREPVKAFVFVLR